MKSQKITLRSMLSLLMIPVVLLSLESCGKKKDKSAVASTSGNAKIDTMSSSVNAALVSAGISSSNASAITGAGLSKASAAGASLTSQLNLSSQEVVAAQAIADDFVGGAVEGAGSTDLTEADKLNAVKVVLTTSVAQLNELELLPTLADDQAELIGAMVGKGAESLDQAGLSGETLVDAASQLASSVAEVLSDAGVDIANVSVVFGGVTSSVVQAFNEAGITGDDIAKTIEEMTELSFAAIQKEFTFSPEQEKAFAASYAAGVVASFDEAGVSTTNFSSVMEDVMGFVTANLDALGMTPTEIGDSIATLAGAVIKSIGSVEGADVSAMSAAAVTGYTGALDEAGVVEKSQISSMSSSFMTNSISALDDIPGVDQSKVSGIATAMADGAEKGLLDANFTQSEAQASGSTFDSAATQAATVEAAEIAAKPATTTPDAGSTTTTAPSTTNSSIMTP